MTIKWKAAIAGGTVAGIGLGGIGLGGFAAADDVDRQVPGAHTQQQSASSWPVRLKFKGGSWYPDLAGADGLMSVSVNSPWSSDFDSPNSPGSIDSIGTDSPAAPPSGGGGGGSGSNSGGGSGSGS
jgi:hypothetical protein